MIGGQLQQTGPVESVFDAPADADVAAEDTAEFASEVFACIRAESVTIERRASPNATSARNHLPARIVSQEEMRLREGERVTAVVKASSILIVPR